MYMLWFKLFLWFEFFKTSLNFSNWSENCRDRKANTLGQSQLITKVMYDLVTLTSTILEIFIERLLKAMHGGCRCTLNMSILAITVVNVLLSNINLLETASATNHA